MTWVLKLAAAGASLTLCLGAPAASAAIVTATYAGTVGGTSPLGETGGAFDNTSVFGAVTNLEGLGFTAAFTFDTDLGQRVTAPGQDQLVGGSSFGLTSPFLSATLTIEGVQHAFLSDALGVVFVVTDGVNNATLHQAASNFTPDFLSAGLQNPALPLLVTGPFSGDYLSSDPTNPTIGEFLISDGTNAAAHGYLLADHLTVSSVAVPEPAGWSLMLLGFGGLGAMARRARRLSPVAATS